MKADQRIHSDDLLPEEIASVHQEMQTADTDILIIRPGERPLVDQRVPRRVSAAQEDPLPELQSGVASDSDRSGEIVDSRFVDPDCPGAVERPLQSRRIVLRSLIRTESALCRIYHDVRPFKFSSGSGNDQKAFLEYTRSSALFKELSCGKRESAPTGNFPFRVCKFRKIVLY